MRNVRSTAVSSPVSLVVFLLLIAAAVLLMLGVVAWPSPARGGTFGKVIVTTSLDNDVIDLSCSLREAIIATNNDMDYHGCVGNSQGSDGIQFNVGTTPTINVSTPLPTITAAIVIDGATGGATRVELHGPGDADPMDALTILGASAGGTQIKSLVINNFAGSGIEISAPNVVVTNSFIGTDAAGTSAVPNTRGIYVAGGANARIGGSSGTNPTGSCAGDCNVISGNSQQGVYLSSGAAPVVQGNFIGTDVTGSISVANSTGIHTQVSGALIGGAAAGAGNLISGNSGVGINATATVTIQGNRIGANSAGTTAVPNEIGIALSSGSQTSLVGGSSAGAANLISGNSGLAGIWLRTDFVSIQGNLIGTRADGTTALPNTDTGILIQSAMNNVVGVSGLGGQANVVAFNGGSGVAVDGQTTVGNQIRRNSIFSNSIGGIDNVDGGNRELDPPAIVSADAQTVSGTAMIAVCGFPCGIDVYSDDDAQGRVYEGSTTTDMTGDWTFSGALSGPNITATANDDGGNTSEFSAPFTLPLPTPTPSPTPTTIPTPTATPTPTPTATPTPTPTATPTPTPTGTAPTNRIQGDVNCDGEVDQDDFDFLIRFAAGLNEGSTPGNCADLGDMSIAAVTVFPWGDVNCDSAVDAIDSLYVLAHTVDIDLPQVGGNCIPIGEDIG